MIPPPKELTAFPTLKPVKPKTPVQGGGGLRKRWKDEVGNIYEWDSQHGTVEKYNKRGKHLGEFNPDTGELLTKRVLSNLNNQETSQMSTTVKRVLRAYEKSGETLLQEWPLSGIPLTKLQKLFGHQADNSMYDCYLLPPEHLPWLEKYVVNQSHGQLDSHSYDYFLECDRA